MKWKNGVFTSTKVIEVSTKTVSQTRYCYDNEREQIQHDSHPALLIDNKTM